MSSDGNMNERTTVILPVQNDITSDEIITPQYLPLRKLLKEYCRGPYSSEVDEFSMVLRVDGDLVYWKKEGCDRMRRSKKGRYITIDIYVPRERWDGVRGIEIRRYLAACAEDALHRMIGKLQHDKAPVDGAALLRDFALVKERYLPQVAAVSVRDI